MGLDLSSGIKYFLNQIGKTDNLSYVCDFGYLHAHSSDKLKEYNKEIEWAKNMESDFLMPKTFFKIFWAKK